MIVLCGVIVERESCPIELAAALRMDVEALKATLRLLQSFAGQAEEPQSRAMQKLHRGCRIGLAPVVRAARQASQAVGQSRAPAGGGMMNKSSACSVSLSSSGRAF